MTPPPTSTDDVETTRPTVLVPLAVVAGESLPAGVPALLANARIVLLGYHEIPDQTATEQAREQFGEAAMSKLEEIGERLTAAGAHVESRLVFTHDAETTIDRLIYEHDCLAVLVSNSTDRVESVLVAIRGAIAVGQNTALVSGLFAGTDVGVTLYHALTEDTTEADAEAVLATARADLLEHGLEESQLETVIEPASDPVEAVANRSVNHDAVIMGETDPSVTTFVFGMPAAQVATEFLGPVLVVQREKPE